MIILQILLLPTKRRDKPTSARARASDNRFSLSRKLCIPTVPGGEGREIFFREK